MRTALLSHIESSVFLHMNCALCPEIPGTAQGSPECCRGRCEHRENLPDKIRQLFTPIPSRSWMLHWERGSARVARSQAALVSAYIDMIKNLMATRL